MYKVSELIQQSSQFLKNKRVKGYKRCAEELLAFVLNLKRLDLFFNYNSSVSESKIRIYRSLLKRKAEGEPMGYLLEKTNFLDCILYLSKSVLIPRQETEILVSIALKEIPNEPKVLWDVCCGSGCMGLAAKKHRPNVKVILSDLSYKALACAKNNAKYNDLNVKFIQGDLLAPFKDQKADFIFCNPPYISDLEYLKLNLEKEVYFEPKLALFAKKGGLEFYFRLKRDLPYFLRPKAKVFFEIGSDQGKDVIEIFDESHWKNKRCEKDWSGNERFFFLDFNPN